MAQLIIPLAASGLGWYVGQGTGAAIGWMIASALTAESPKIALPQIGDLRVQTSEYGRTIPLVVGKQRLAGNVIWSTDKVAHQTSQRSGGKGGFGGGVETIVTTYTVSMAVAICKGPILGITRVWSDGTIVSAAGSGQTRMPGKIYLGSNTQNADPTIVSVEGVGNVPAYRGIAYMVFTDFDLGASGRVPMFSFEIVKEGGI